MEIKKTSLRLIISVVAGIVISKILTTITHEALHLGGAFPGLGDPMFDPYLLSISLGFHSVYAVVGAYITAMIAKERAQKAVFILGTKEAVLWLLGTILLWKQAPPWYNISKAVLGIPLALLGGLIYKWYKAKNLETKIKLNTH